MLNQTQNVRRRRTAKDCAFLAVFVAVVIAAQAVLSALPGIEIVTVLFVSYSFSVEAKRGMLAATVFSLLRQIIFGFFPNVLLLYLIYYNLLAYAFSRLGRNIKNPIKSLLIIVIAACLGTIFFFVLDSFLTPIWYGFSARATRAYVLASLPFMIPQVICTAVSVAILFCPLVKIFKIFL